MKQNVTEIRHFRHSTFDINACEKLPALLLSWACIYLFTAIRI